MMMKDNCYFFYFGLVNKSSTKTKSEKKGSVINVLRFKFVFFRRGTET